MVPIFILSLQLLRDYEQVSEKYAYTKACSLDSIWRYAPAASKDFQHLPIVYMHIKSFNYLLNFTLPYVLDFIQVDKTLVETDEKVGQYIVEQKLGDGQHSIVRKCSLKDGNTKQSFAIKIIAKDRIRSIDGVLRVEEELVVFLHIYFVIQLIMYYFRPL